MKPVRSFSWRYRNLLGIEGSWDPQARKVAVAIVLLGGALKIAGGLTATTRSVQDQINEVIVKPAPPP